MTKFTISIVFLVIGSLCVDAGLVSRVEFINAVTSSGYSRPKSLQYDSFVNYLRYGNIIDKVEAAMFLAQALWESSGLRYKRELACIKTGCPGKYDSSVGVKGKNYYGRGYLQLTHSYNYKEASLYLYHDLFLIRYPEHVAECENAAWGTAIWFWMKNVHNRTGVQQHHFGSTTRAINSGECTGDLPAAHKRFDIYRKVLVAFNISEEPNEEGCYSLKPTTTIHPPTTTSHPPTTRVKK